MGRIRNPISHMILADKSKVSDLHDQYSMEPASN